jgi:hypothetical protein
MTGKAPGGTDYRSRALTLPGYVFLYREWCESKRVAGFFGWLLIPLVDVPTLDHDTMSAGRAINANQPKENSSKRIGTRLVINPTQVQTKQTSAFLARKHIIS